MSNQAVIEVIRDLQHKSAALLREHKAKQIAIEVLAKEYGLNPADYLGAGGDGSVLSPAVVGEAQRGEVEATTTGQDEKPVPPRVPGYPYDGSNLDKTRFVLRELGRGQRSDVTARIAEIEGREVSSSTVYDNLKRLANPRKGKPVAKHHTYDDPQRRQDNYFEWIGDLF